MNSTFKKVALASALLATSALVAPAYAANLAGDVSAPGSYVAPVTAADANQAANTAIKPVIGYGTNIVLKHGATEVTGTASATVTYNLYYYGADGSYKFKSGDVTEAGGAGSVTLTTTGNSAVKKVAIVVKAGTGDTIGSGTGVYGVVNAIKAGGSATQVKYTVADISPSTASAEDIAAAAKASAIDMDSTYAGPVLTAANKKDGNNTDKAVAYFSMPLALVSTGTDVATTLVAKKSDGTALTTKTFAAINAGDTYVQLGGDTSTQFSATAATLTPTFLSSSPILKDLAGNSIASGSAMALTPFDVPKFATTGTAKVSLVDGATTTELFSTNGKSLAAAETVTVRVRFAEAMDSSVSVNKQDYSITDPNGLSITGVTDGTANDQYVDLVLTAGAAMTLKVDASTGALTVTNGATTTTPTINLAVDTANSNSKMKTKLGGTDIVSAPTTAEKIYVGLTPDAYSLKTYDADADGTLDGAQIVATAPLSSSIPSGHGISIVKSSDTTVSSALGTLSLDPNDSKTLRVPGTQATISGWIASPQTIADNLNTGSAGASLPYGVSISSSALTYASVYNPATGVLTTLANNTPATNLADGAKPVVKKASFQKEEGKEYGQLKIVASEALSVTDMDTSASATGKQLDLQQILIGGSPLTLLNLANGVTTNASSFSNLKKTNITDDTILIGGTAAADGKVTSAVLNKYLSFSSSSKSGLSDTATPKNDLTTAANGVQIEPGDTVYAGPQIAQAIGIRSDNQVDGAITSVLVKFDKAVKFASDTTGTGKAVDGLFKVRASIKSGSTTTPYTVSVPASGITLDDTGTYVTLTLPTPGIIGTTALQSLIVEYDTNGTQDNLDVGTTLRTSLNRLVGVSGGEIADRGTAFDTTNDADTRDVTFNSNSTKLYTMEVTGKLTTNGTDAAAKGTIVRADLVDMGTTLTVKGGTLTVPCSCTAGTTSLALTAGDDNTTGYSFSGIANALKNAAKTGKSSINAYARVSLNGNTASATSVTLAETVGDADEKLKSYPVTISTSGQVTGTAGVVGNLVLENTPALKVLDTVYQVTNDGAFRFAVGSDTAPSDAFVLVSSKQPADQFFTGLTSPVQSFANYVPFASNVTASGTIGGVLGTINLAKIASASVDLTTGWQLVGFQGQIARNSNATLKAKAVDLTRLLITPRPTTGQPVTAWGYDAAGTGSADDEGFLLQNNVTASALQIGTVTVDGIKDINGGLSLALKNASGGFTRDDTVGSYEITSGDTDTAIVTATEPFTVFYPISGDTTAYSAAAGKWSLLTMEQAVATASLSDWATTNKVAAIIVVGSGNAQKSWFKGSTTNTLTALAKGDRAFIYFESANTAYKFGR